MGAGTEAEAAETAPVEPVNVRDSAADSELNLPKADESSQETSATAEKEEAKEEKEGWVVCTFPRGMLTSVYSDTAEAPSTHAPATTSEETKPTETAPEPVTATSEAPAPVDTDDVTAEAAPAVTESAPAATATDDAAKAQDEAAAEVKAEATTESNTAEEAKA